MHWHFSVFVGHILSLAENVIKKRHILDNLLRQVLVFPGGRLEIRGRFREELERLRQHPCAKTYTKDFRTYKSVKNTNQNMYFEKTYAAIIPKSDWLRAQEILSLRRGVKKAVRLRRLGEKFVAPRVKSGLLQGNIFWTPDGPRCCARPITKTGCSLHGPVRQTSSKG